MSTSSRAAAPLLLFVAATLLGTLASCRPTPQADHSPAGSALRPGESPPSGAAPRESGQPPSRSTSVQPTPRPPAATVPSGTTLTLVLDTPLASDRNQVEDPVRARLARAVVVNGRTVIPEGSQVLGTVTTVERPGRVKGRARLAVRFHTLVLPNAASLALQTDRVTWEARGTQKKDAATIALPAAGGAIVGGAVGGAKGTAVGAAIGGAAGTAVVLASRGEELRISAGRTVRVSLRSPLVVPLSP